MTRFTCIYGGGVIMALATVLYGLGTSYLLGFAHRGLQQSAGNVRLVEVTGNSKREGEGDQQARCPPYPVLSSTLKDCKAQLSRGSGVTSYRGVSQS